MLIFQAKCRAKKTTEEKDAARQKNKEKMAMKTSKASRASLGANGCPANGGPASLRLRATGCADGCEQDKPHVLHGASFGITTTIRGQAASANAVNCEKLWARDEHVMSA